MHWNDLPERHPKRMKVRELSKTAYDAWVMAPSLDQLVLGIKSRPKSYANVFDKEVIEYIYNQLKSHDPLFSKLSPEILKTLLWSISICYCGINGIDKSQGGDGMLVPTFVEIMHCFIFTVRGRKEMVNIEDYNVYNKYFWAFELKCSLIDEQLADDNKIAA